MLASEWDLLRSLGRKQAPGVRPTPGARGVEFLSPPKEEFYGVEAILKDNSGNWFSMSEPKGS